MGFLFGLLTGIFAFVATLAIVVMHVLKLNLDLHDPKVKTIHNGTSEKAVSIEKNSHALSDISEARLRQMIQKIVAETINLPPLSNGHAVSELALDTSNQTMAGRGSLNSAFNQRHRTEHYFEPAIYQDLLATAVLNKIVGRQFKNIQNSSKTETGTGDDVLNGNLRHTSSDQNFNAEKQSTSSGSSVEPHSDYSFPEVEQIFNNNDDKSSELLRNSDRDSVMSDYLANHMIPLPELNAITTESEEDDYTSVTSSAVGDETWEKNWLFKKKKSALSGSVTTSSIGILVPDPKEDVRAQIGDKTADEVSDLSELGSDSDDSLNSLRSQLDPINDRLINKHLIGGQNSKMILDELIERSSMISNTLPNDTEPPYTDARNEHIIQTKASNEAVNDNISQQQLQQQQNINEQIAASEVLKDFNSNSLAASEDISESDGCTGFSDVEIFESSGTPSVVEILAAMALGPMLAVPSIDQPIPMTISDINALTELKELALAEIKAHASELTPRNLDVIPEELGDVTSQTDNLLVSSAEEFDFYRQENEQNFQPPMLREIAEFKTKTATFVEESQLAINQSENEGAATTNQEIGEPQKEGTNYAPGKTKLNADDNKMKLESADEDEENKSQECSELSVEEKCKEEVECITQTVSTETTLEESSKTFIPQEIISIDQKIASQIKITELEESSNEQVALVCRETPQIHQLGICSDSFNDKADEKLIPISLSSEKISKESSENIEKEQTGAPETESCIETSKTEAICLERSLKESTEIISEIKSSEQEVSETQIDIKSQPIGIKAAQSVLMDEEESKQTELVASANADNKVISSEKNLEVKVLEFTGENLYLEILSERQDLTEATAHSSTDNQLDMQAKPFSIDQTSKKQNIFDSDDAEISQIHQILDPNPDAQTKGTELVHKEDLFDPLSSECNKRQQTEGDSSEETPQASSNEQHLEAKAENSSENDILKDEVGRNLSKTAANSTEQESNTINTCDAQIPTLQFELVLNEHPDSFVEPANKPPKVEIGVNTTEMITKEEGSSDSNPTNCEHSNAEQNSLKRPAKQSNLVDQSTEQTEVICEDHLLDIQSEPSSLLHESLPNTSRISICDQGKENIKSLEAISKQVTKIISEWQSTSDDVEKKPNDNLPLLDTSDNLSGLSENLSEESASNESDEIVVSEVTLSVEVSKEISEIVSGVQTEALSGGSETPLNDDLDSLKVVEKTSQEIAETTSIEELKTENLEREIPKLMNATNNLIEESPKPVTSSEEQETEASHTLSPSNRSDETAKSEVTSSVEVSKEFSQTDPEDGPQATSNNVEKPYNDSFEAIKSASEEIPEIISKEQPLLSNAEIPEKSVSELTYASNDLIEELSKAELDSGEHQTNTNTENIFGEEPPVTSTNEGDKPAKPVVVSSIEIKEEITETVLEMQLQCVNDNAETADPGPLNLPERVSEETPRTLTKDEASDTSVENSEEALSEQTNVKNDVIDKSVNIVIDAKEQEANAKDLSKESNEATEETSLVDAAIGPFNAVLEEQAQPSGSLQNSLNDEPYPSKSENREDLSNATNNLIEETASYTSNLANESEEPPRAEENSETVLEEQSQAAHDSLEQLPNANSDTLKVLQNSEEETPATISKEQSLDSKTEKSEKVLLEQAGTTNISIEKSSKPDIDSEDQETNTKASQIASSTTESDEPARAEVVSLVEVPKLTAEAVLELQPQASGDSVDKPLDGDSSLLKAVESSLNEITEIIAKEESSDSETESSEVVFLESLNAANSSNEESWSTAMDSEKQDELDEAAEIEVASLIGVTKDTGETIDSEKQPQIVASGSIENSHDDGSDSLKAVEILAEAIQKEQPPDSETESSEKSLANYVGSANNYIQESPRPDTESKEPDINTKASHTTILSNESAEILRAEMTSKETTGRTESEEQPRTATETVSKGQTQDLRVGNLEKDLPEHINAGNNLISDSVDIATVPQEQDTNDSHTLTLSNEFGELDNATSSVEVLKDTVSKGQPQALGDHMQNLLTNECLSEKIAEVLPLDSKAGNSEKAAVDSKEQEASTKAPLTSKSEEPVNAEVTSAAEVSEETSDTVSEHQAQASYVDSDSLKEVASSAENISDEILAASVKAQPFNLKTENSEENGSEEINSMNNISEESSKTDKDSAEQDTSSLTNVSEVINEDQLSVAEIKLAGPAKQEIDFSDNILEITEHISIGNSDIQEENSEYSIKSSDECREIGKSSSNEDKSEKEAKADQTDLATKEHSECPNNVTEERISNSLEELKERQLESSTKEANRISTELLNETIGSAKILTVIDNNFTEKEPPKQADSICTEEVTKIRIEQTEFGLNEKSDSLMERTGDLSNAEVTSLENVSEIVLKGQHTEIIIGNFQQFSSKQSSEYSETDSGKCGVNLSKDIFEGVPEEVLMESSTIQLEVAPIGIADEELNVEELIVTENDTAAGQSNCEFVIATTEQTFEQTEIGSGGTTETLENNSEFLTKEDSDTISDNCCLISTTEESEKAVKVSETKVEVNIVAKIQGVSEIYSMEMKPEDVPDLQPVLAVEKSQKIEENKSQEFLEQTTGIKSEDSKSNSTDAADNLITEALKEHSEIEPTALNHEEWSDISDSSIREQSKIAVPSLQEISKSSDEITSESHIVEESLGESKKSTSEITTESNNVQLNLLAQVVYGESRLDIETNSTELDDGKYEAEALIKVTTLSDEVSIAEVSGTITEKIKEAERVLSENVNESKKTKALPQEEIQDSRVILLFEERADFSKQAVELSIFEATAEDETKPAEQSLELKVDNSKETNIIVGEALKTEAIEEVEDSLNESSNVTSPLHSEEPSGFSNKEVKVSLLENNSKDGTEVDSKESHYIGGVTSNTAPIDETVDSTENAVDTCSKIASFSEQHSDISDEKVEVNSFDQIAKDDSIREDHSLELKVENTNDANRVVGEATETEPIEEDSMEIANETFRKLESSLVEIAAERNSEKQCDESRYEEGIKDSIEHPKIQIKMTCEEQPAEQQINPSLTRNDKSLSDELSSLETYLMDEKTQVSGKLPIKKTDSAKNLAKEIIKSEEKPKEEEINVVSEAEIERTDIFSDCSSDVLAEKETSKEALLQDIAKQVSGTKPEEGQPNLQAEDINEQKLFSSAVTNERKESTIETVPEKDPLDQYLDDVNDFATGVSEGPIEQQLSLNMKVLTEDQILENHNKETESSDDICSTTADPEAIEPKTESVSFDSTESMSNSITEIANIDLPIHLQLGESVNNICEDNSNIMDDTPDSATLKAISSKELIMETSGKGVESKEQESLCNENVDFSNNAKEQLPESCGSQTTNLNPEIISQHAMSETASNEHSNSSKTTTITTKVKPLEETTKDTVEPFSEQPQLNSTTEKLPLEHLNTVKTFAEEVLKIEKYPKSAESSSQEASITEAQDQTIVFETEIFERDSKTTSCLVNIALPKGLDSKTDQNNSQVEVVSEEQLEESQVTQTVLISNKYSDPESSTEKNSIGGIDISHSETINNVVEIFSRAEDLENSQLSPIIVKASAEQLSETEAKEVGCATDEHIECSAGKVVKLGSLDEIAKETAETSSDKNPTEADVANADTMTDTVGETSKLDTESKEKPAMSRKKSSELSETNTDQTELDSEKHLDFEEEPKSQKSILFEVIAETLSLEQTEIDLTKEISEFDAINKEEETNLPNKMFSEEQLSAALTTPSGFISNECLETLSNENDANSSQELIEESLKPPIRHFEAKNNDVQEITETKAELSLELLSRITEEVNSTEKQSIEIGKTDQPQDSKTKECEEVVLDVSSDVIEEPSKKDGDDVQPASKVETEPTVDSLKCIVVGDTSPVKQSIKIGAAAVKNLPQGTKTEECEEVAFDTLSEVNVELNENVEAINDAIHQEQLATLLIKDGETVTDEPNYAIFEEISKIEDKLKENELSLKSDTRCDKQFSETQIELVSEEHSDTTISASVERTISEEIDETVSCDPPLKELETALLEPASDTGNSRKGMSPEPEIFEETVEVVSPEQSMNLITEVSEGHVVEETMNIEATSEDQSDDIISETMTESKITEHIVVSNNKQSDRTISGVICDSLEEVSDAEFHMKGIQSIEELGIDVAKSLESEEKETETSGTLDSLVDKVTIKGPGEIAEAILENRATDLTGESVPQIEKALKEEKDSSAHLLETQILSNEIVSAKQPANGLEEIDSEAIPKEQTLNLETINSQVASADVTSDDVNNSEETKITSIESINIANDTLVKVPIKAEEYTSKCSSTRVAEIVLNVLTEDLNTESTSSSDSNSEDQPSRVSVETISAESLSEMQTKQAETVSNEKKDFLSNNPDENLKAEDILETSLEEHPISETETETPTGSIGKAQHNEAEETFSPKDDSNATTPYIPGAQSDQIKLVSEHYLDKVDSNISSEIKTEGISIDKTVDQSLVEPQVQPKKDSLAYTIVHDKVLDADQLKHRLDTTDFSLSIVEEEASLEDSPLTTRQSTVVEKEIRSSCLEEISSTGNLKISKKLQRQCRVIDTTPSFEDINPTLMPQPSPSNTSSTLANLCQKFIHDKHLLTALKNRRRRTLLMHRFLSTLDLSYSVEETQTAQTETLDTEQPVVYESLTHFCANSSYHDDCSESLAFHIAEPDKISYNFINTVLFSDQLSHETKPFDGSQTSTVEEYLENGNDNINNLTTNSCLTANTNASSETNSNANTNSTKTHNHKHSVTRMPPSPTDQGQPLNLLTSAVENTDSSLRNIRLSLEDHFKTDQGQENHNDNEVGVGANSDFVGEYVEKQQDDHIVVDDDDDDIVAIFRHFVPGSIAEREYKKWYNAVEMPNNPYSPEALKRRISGSQERSIDLPNISPTKDLNSLNLLNESTIEAIDAEDNVKLENDYKRYSRDYYINSSLTIPQTTPAKAPPTHVAKENREHTNMTASCRRAETEDYVYKARPAQVIKEDLCTMDTALAPVDQPANSMSVSEDSDTIKYTDAGKQQHDIKPGKVRAEEKASGSDLTKSESGGNGAAAARGSTPVAFKFLQPKRKLLEPNQVLTVDEEGPKIASSQWEKPVIEEEVIKALPSVKALAKTFLMTTNTTQPEKLWLRKARTLSQGERKRAASPKQYLDQLAGPERDKPEDDVTITSDLSSLETDSSSMGAEHPTSCKSSNDPPFKTEPLRQGVLKTNIAFFENLKNK